MARIKSIRRATGTTVTDNERKINYALQKGYNMFELQFKKRAPYDQTYFGFDDIRIERIESPNSMEIRMAIEIEPVTQIAFTQNEEGVSVCYLPDTPRNRKLLALQLYECDWVITRLITPQMEKPASQIQAEILAYAKELGVKPPAPTARNPRNAIPVKPSPKTVAEVEAQVFAKHSVLIDALKKEHGADFRSSAIFMSVVLTEIDGICAGFGIKTQADNPIGGAEPVSEKKIATRTSPKKPVKVVAKEPVMEESLVE